MFAPRSVAAKGKGKAVEDFPPALDAGATSATEGDESTAIDNVEEESAHVVDPEARARLAAILFELEVILSDWGLARFPTLLERVRGDADGYVHIQHPLALPPLQALDVKQGDVLALRPVQSDLIELSDDGYRIRRKTPISDAALAHSLADWADMTFYVEDLPQIPGHPSNSSSVRQLLTEVFDTPVQTVRFPPLYDRNDAKSNDRNATGDTGVYELHPAFANLEKDARRSQRLPLDGGPCKGFAFIVLADKAKATAALQAWPYSPVATAETVSVNGASDDHEATDGEGAEAANGASAKSEAKSALQRAKASGLKLLPLTEFNAFRASYLSYKRGLEKLEDEYDERDHRDWRERDRKRDRDRYDRSAHGSRRDDSSRYNKPRVAADDAEDGPRPSDAARWGHREPSPQPDDDNGTSSLVQLRNVHPRAKPPPLKAALNAILVSLTAAGEVRFVDQTPGSKRAIIRVSTAEAAQALVDHFAKGDMRTHADPFGEGEDAFEPLGPMDEDAPIVRASLLSAEEDKAYRAEAKRAEWADTEGDRRAGSKRRGGGTSSRSKHTRFD